MGENRSLAPDRPTKAASMHRVPLLAALIVALVPVPAPAQDIFEANRALRRGVNIANALEVPRGQDWGFTLKMEHFQVIKSAGFDHVRVPVRWSDYAAKAPPYTIEEAWFKRIDKVLDECEKQKLRVVLNAHHYEEMKTAPREHLPRLVAIWKQIAARYAKRPSTLYFEPLNEPSDALTAALWNEAIPKLLAVIRETNPTRPVIVGPIEWNNISQLKTLKLPDDKHLIVTIHYYLPFDFTHQGAFWTDPEVRDLVDRRWPKGADEVEQLKRDFAEAAKWAKEQNRPIYLGEFGVYEKAPLESRAEWTRAVASEASAHGFSIAYWDFGAGFGVYDPRNRAWRKPILDAILQSKR